MQTTTSSVKEIINNTTVQYSKINYLNYNNSTVEILKVLDSLTDIVPDDGYKPFYVSRFKKLGYKRFMELVQKARVGSDTPMKLFAWMLKNHELVK